MQTKRLKLRVFEPGDASRVAELAGVWDIACMTARLPFPYTEPLAHKWISGIEPDEFVRAVDFSGQLIGAVGYMPAKDGSAEIGYWIGKPWWGQGFATEAAEALVHYCFGSRRIGRLICCHFVDNPASARVIAKLGFRLVGQCKAWCEARQAEVDTLRYERRRPVMARFWRRAA